MLTQSLQHFIHHDPQLLRRNGFPFLCWRKYILKRKTSVFYLSLSVITWLKIKPGCRNDRLQQWRSESIPFCRENGRCDIFSWRWIFKQCMCYVNLPVRPPSVLLSEEEKRRLRQNRIRPLKSPRPKLLESGQVNLVPSRQTVFLVQVSFTDKTDGHYWTRCTKRTAIRPGFETVS